MLNDAKNVCSDILKIGLKTKQNKKTSKKKTKTKTKTKQTKQRENILDCWRWLIDHNIIKYIVH